MVGEMEVDKSLGYGLCYPWSLSDGSHRHKNREGSPRVRQTRGVSDSTVIGETLEALTKLGMLNSRMKDYYDLALLSRMYSFEGES
jgi:hypothetical protein